MVPETRNAIRVCLNFITRATPTLCGDWADDLDDALMIGSINCRKVTGFHYAQHLFVPAVLFMIALGCFGGMIAFISVAERWPVEQQTCYDARPINATCTITGIEMMNSVPNVDYPEQDKARFYFVADVPELSLTDVQLFPDCRYIIRTAYVGFIRDTGVSISRFPPYFSAIGSNITCLLPSSGKVDPGQNVTGVFVNNIFQSSTGAIGWKATLGIAISCLILSGIITGCVLFSCRGGCDRDCYKYDEEMTSYGNVCGKHRGWYNPLICHCTLNPYYCLKFCIPLLFIWKMFLNFLVFIVIVLGIALYLLTKVDVYYY